MASTTVAKKKAATPAAKNAPMFEKLTEPDDDGNWTAKIFGEEFTLSDDVNGWLIMLAGGGDLRAIRDLVDSLLVVEPEEGESVAMATRRIGDKFHKLIGSQRNFSIEDAMTLVNDLQEAAGNDLPE